MSSLSVELFTWFVQTIVDIFFREVSTRGSFNLPQSGATIVVIAPHANQFLDAAVTMYIVNRVTGRPTYFIEAATSFRRRVIGAFSRWSGAIPVERPQDLLVNRRGSITFKNYPEDQVTIIGKGTQFTKDCEVKGIIGLPQSVANAKVASIESDTELTLAKPVGKSRGIELLIEGTTYKAAPKIDNHQLFDTVFDRLNQGDLIAIAAEGGSHDRTQLLPFKPGFAIMALGATAKYPDTQVSIVPCGLNYFHPHKFRSRAVLEFGEPIVITAEDGKEYEKDSRKKVDEILKKVTGEVKAVTVQSPDYETLQVIQAARRLYAYPKKNIPLPLVVEMNRNLLLGYTKFQDDPQIQHLKQSVMDYNKKLSYLGLSDHQVEYWSGNVFHTSYLLIKRVVGLILLASLSLPGTVLFSPVFIACKLISRKKQREALAKSSVKIKGNDVLGSWKVLIALVFSPALYLFYSLIGTYLVGKYDLLPHWWIFTNRFNVFVCCWTLLVVTTYNAFRIGEIGMDILKSLRPLWLSLSHKSRQVESLKKERQKLSAEVTQVINDLGPKVFPKFSESHLDKVRDEVEYEKEEVEEVYKERSRSRSRSRSGLSRTTSIESGFSELGGLPNLSNVSIFPDALQLDDSEPSSALSDDIEKLQGLRSGVYQSGSRTTSGGLSSRVRDEVLKRNLQNDSE